MEKLNNTTAFIICNQEETFWKFCDCSFSFFQAQFFPPSKFLHYNMFNNYFFGGEAAEKTVKGFIAEAKPGKIALVMDPPFGGMMSILAASLKKLLAAFDKGGSTLIFRLLFYQ